MSKFNFKSFISGIIVGGLLISIIPVSAAVQNVTAKLGNVNCKINNTNTTLNSINYNSKNYVQLRDIVTKMGGNIAVSDNTIVINSNQNEPVGDSVSTNTMTKAIQDTPTTTDSNQETKTVSEKPTSTPDGITQIDKWEGKYYIAFIYIKNKIKEKGYILSKDTKSNIWNISKDNNIIINNIPMTIIYGCDSLEYNYYINAILPLII